MKINDDFVNMLSTTLTFASVSLVAVSQAPWLKQWGGPGRAVLSLGVGGLTYLAAPHYLRLLYGSYYEAIDFTVEAFGRENIDKARNKNPPVWDSTGLLGAVTGAGATGWVSFSAVSNTLGRTPIQKFPFVALLISGCSVALVLAPIAGSLSVATPAAVFARESES